MIPGQKRKPQIGFWIVLLIAAAYLAYSAAKCGKLRLSDEWAAAFKAALAQPLPIAFNEWTARYFVFALCAWGVAFLTYLSSIHTFMPGEEYGTSKFVPPEEINRQLAKKRPGYARLLLKAMKKKMKSMRKDG